jgi:HAD superfamily hydrolase (TIGR01662 family)
MVCGAPASGKSSVTKTFVNDQGYVSLNRDTEGGTILSLLPKMEALLQQNKDIVLDNLFPTIEVRKPFIELAKLKGVDIRCVLMGTSIEDCTFNVVQRAFSLINKFPSPEAVKAAKHTNVFPPLVLFRYKKEFQKPTVTEGFSSVEVVPFIRKDDPTFTAKAIIVDYDGTLRECIGGNGKFPTEIDQIKILPKRKEILQSYKDKGYLLLGVSNQSGIAKGDLTYDKAVELFEYTNAQLGLDIEYKFCSHQAAPISCYCRKPQTGLFVDFMLQHKLSRKDCIFVGDMTSDRTFSTRAGIKYMDQADFFK